MSQPFPAGIEENGNHQPVGHSVGGLVLGGDYQGLGIVRSLGREGVPVCVIDDERSIARFSRYAALAQRTPSLSSPDGMVQTLLDLERKLGLRGWVIYPTRDEQVATISQHRDTLSAVFRVPTPPWDTIKWLWDKRNTYQLAGKLGIPTPKTWYPRCVEDLEAVESFPVAIKPAIKEHFIYATKAKAWRADSLPQLRDLYQRALQLLPADEIILQDLIPGDGTHQSAFCAFFKDGKAVASLTACRRRQHPLELGRSSTYVETVDLPEIEDYAQRFLRTINYYGLVEVEFKRDPRDGEYRLLDVNGRTWGYHTIGRHSGINFSHMLFLDQLNESVEPRKGKAGVRWIRLLTDLPTGVVGVLHGQFKWFSYLRSLWNCDEEAVFSLEDPLPGLVELALIPYLTVKRGF
jgi:predicted ATP-grasp superfamily ATP-dependent carboligase